MDLLNAINQLVWQFYRGMRIEETRVWVWCGYLPWVTSSATVHTSSIPTNSTVRHTKYGGQAPEGPLLPTFSSSINTQ